MYNVQKYTPYIFNYLLCYLRARGGADGWGSTSRKVTGSIPVVVTVIFYVCNDTGIK
jgi:hypothetical protein